MNLLRTQIQSPAAWKGPEIDWRDLGLHLMTAEDCREIDQALRHLQSLGEVDLPDVTPEKFPLHRMARLMEDLPKRLREGPGFLMLRGLQRERYTPDEMAQIYFGLASYAGAPMTQSYLGDLMGHVVDVSDLEPKSRGYRKGGGQLMHTDSCDIIGLMCLRSALSGGKSRISSALSVHNHMALHYPELLDVLIRGLYLKRTDEDGRHATRTYSEHRVPFFHESGTEVTCYLPTGYARLAEKSGHRDYTPEESKALYTVRKVSESPELFLDMGFQPGDIQFLNNRVMVHGRTDYVDAKPLDERRHLLRMWIRAKEWPRMPAEQIFHTDEDMRLWSLGRRPFMELPSVHDRDLLNGSAGRMVD